MTEELISFETAKLAYNSGFDWVKSDNKWYEDNGDLDFSFQRYAENTENKITAPTQSLLQKWLREEHNIHVYVIPNNTKRPKGNFEICVHSNNEKLYYHFGFDSWEEALEKGLQEALKVI